MPQASEELRDIIIDWFGSLDMEGPCRVLELRGWTPAGRDGWDWRPPVPSYTPHRIDIILINFLVEEWDWGSAVGLDA